jgi:hypothetical protein
MAIRTCRVSFVDHGKTQSVEVLAETAYEAAILALHAFSKMRYLKGPRRSQSLTIDVIDRRTLTVQVGEVWDWLYEKPAMSAAQRDRKKRLRNILADERR